MSKHHRKIITCPQCGKDDEFLMWDSINTVLDPQMKEKVRTGEAFTWTCPKCGYIGNVHYSTLYHQMEDHVMIYLVTGDKQKAVEFMQGIFRTDNGQLIEKFDEDYQNRVVGTMNEFREKLMILDAGLDDRVIELMKLYLISNLQGNDKNLRIEEFLFDYSKSGESTFAVNTGDNHWGSVDFHKDIYDFIADNFKDEIAMDESVVVDQQWALAMLADHS